MFFMEKCKVMYTLVSAKDLNEDQKSDELAES